MTSIKITFSDNDVVPQQVPKSQNASHIRGWSGGAMVLGKLSVPGRPTMWITVGQGPIALAVGAGGGCLDIFTHIYPFSPLSASLGEAARYRLKYCLKGPLNPKQPTNQTNSVISLTQFDIPFFSVGILISTSTLTSVRRIDILSFFGD